MNESETAFSEQPFRERVREWLNGNAPRTSPQFESINEEVVAARRYQSGLYDAGFAGLQWPVEYGGQGLSATEQRIYVEEAANFYPPTALLTIGLGMVGHAIAELGTEQQRREFVRPIARGDQIWCQLFSEPDAGSDLAAVRTRAAKTDAGWLLNGHKIWTTHAKVADFGVCLARTDADLPKHAGLTMFLVDMRLTGVDVQPLRDMTGIARFNEVFLDDVALGDIALLGEVNCGWQVALSCLEYERQSIGHRRRPRAHGASFGSISEALQRLDPSRDPIEHPAMLELFIAQQLMDAFTDRLSEQDRAGLHPGALGSVGKLLNADLAQRGPDAALDLLGSEAIAWASDDAGRGAFADAMSEAPMWSIAGGTDEIQLNIIGERLLDLPREPSVDTKVPFRTLKANAEEGRKHE